MNCIRHNRLRCERNLGQIRKIFPRNLTELTKIPTELKLSPTEPSAGNANATY